MGADELARAMIHRDEHVGPSLPDGDRLGHVRAPDLIDPLSDDRPVMGMRISLDGSLRCQKIVLLHDPPYPTGGGTDAPMPKPRPYLPVTFPRKRRGFDDGLDMLQKRAVAAGPLRTTTTWGPRLIGGMARNTMPVHRRPGDDGWGDSEWPVVFHQHGRVGGGK